MNKNLPLMNILYTRLFISQPVEYKTFMSLLTDLSKHSIMSVDFK